jgi:phosphoribosylaminoimidazole carboxylase PurE protein
MAKVAILMGSKSDLPALKSAFEIFRNFDIEFTARVMSAHRTPEKALDFASNAASEGYQVVICAAGMAAHLAGVVAAHTTLPVIGIPMSCEPFNGVDALYSTVQMPPGIPVATVTAGKAGAKNAALYAASIIALSEKEVANKLQEFRIEQTNKVIEADTELQEDLANGVI